MHRSLISRGTVTYLALVLMLIMTFASAGGAQSTPAGTPIGNQASATYSDGSAITRTATSNVVITNVQQVGGVTLASAGAKTASPGAQVVYSHTITNTGNGTDLFTLGLATGGTVVQTNTTIYIDANNDGIADNSVNLVGSTVSLAAGASVRVLVTGTVPVSATSGQTGTMTITATSVFDTNQTQNNIDTTTVTSNAVINVTKSLSASSGASPSGPYTVTLTYTNNGNATASALTLIDALPTGMTYVAGSGLWSVTGATALTDATADIQGTGTTINYSFTGSTITAVINTVPNTVSGQLTFKVNIASGLTPQVINNTATYQYNDGQALTSVFNTNAASFTIVQTAGVTMSDTGTSGTGDSDNTLNGFQLVASATQGSTVTFTNVVKNTGNGTDNFNITLSGTAGFPTGTTFALYRSDGVTPLLDSNGDGIPDTGPLASLATYNVIVKATLPPGVSGGGPYTATATATSTVGSATASVTEKLTTITKSTVDITDNTIGGLGVGVGPGGSPLVTNTVVPGASTIFTLYVTNTSTVADTYNLVASTSTTFGGSNTLPAGWTLTFTNGPASPATCTAANLGSTITNTGVVNAGASAEVCAVVTIPASGIGSAPVTQSLYFQSLSPTTNAADTIYNAVTVTTVHNVTFIPNNSGQVYPGGSVVYTHTIKNSGNVTETITFSSSFVSDSQSGWASILFQDVSPFNGSLDGLDTAVTTATTLTLAPGATSVVLFNKVTAPPAAAIGAVDVTTLTATYVGGTAVATDTSTVIAGDLRLSKVQAVDLLCNGTLSAYSASQLTAKSTACLSYQITATNQGTAPVTSVVVSDATPANTLFSTAAAATCTVGGAACSTFVGPPAGGITAPLNGTAGTVTATIPSLAPGASAIITFEVKIN